MLSFYLILSYFEKIFENLPFMLSFSEKVAIIKKSEGGQFVKIYRQFFYILLCSFIGELIKSLLGLPIPGSVVGMIILFIALESKILKIEDVKEAGAWLLGNLTILFVPAGVGVMVSFSALKDIWYILALVSLMVTAISMGVVGVIVQKIKRRFEGSYLDIDDKAKEEDK